MTDKQECHLNDIKLYFESLVDKKYRKGAAEHGGDLQSLTKLQLVDAAIEETIDQFTYLQTLRAKLVKERSD